jgi:hypothetical protein
VSIRPLERWLFANHFVQRIAHKTLFAAAMVLSLAWGAAQGLRPAPAPTMPVASAAEWPAQWDGAPLRPLALSEVEQRFAQQFPGRIARMTDGRQVLVLREVRAPTRMLHPAVDCYRALGYRIAQARLERDAQQKLWRCFSASRARGQALPVNLRVCERIEAADGTSFTDTSAWYWAAASGRSSGPWQAVTTAKQL